MVVRRLAPPLASGRDVVAAMTAGSALFELAWPASRLGEALAALAPDGNAMRRTTPNPPAALHERIESLSDWVEAAASYIDLEAVPVDAFYPELSLMLSRMGR